MGVKTIPARVTFTCDGAGCGFRDEGLDSDPPPIGINDVYVIAGSSRNDPLARAWLCQPCQTKLQDEIKGILATRIALPAA